MFHVFGSDHFTPATLTSFPFTGLSVFTDHLLVSLWIPGSLHMFISKLKYNKIQTLSVYNSLVQKHTSHSFHQQKNGPATFMF